MAFAYAGCHNGRIARGTIFPAVGLRGPGTVEWYKVGDATNIACNDENYDVGLLAIAFTVWSVYRYYKGHSKKLFLLVRYPSPLGDMGEKLILGIQAPRNEFETVMVRTVKQLLSKFDGFEIYEDDIPALIESEYARAREAAKNASRGTR